ncbi:hypothetical protein IFM89_003235 [Coptis chinensis]|uniref:Uncharacterized protein n=1 Tax=Coptis chinensis TaxID=261450 RepID=A0A835H1H5_9MAGN|nr:hypothetical protein IFM89_003235 [Coptis chinensis]
MVEMEKLADYTCDPEYMSSWNLLMAQQDNFITAVRKLSLGYGNEFDINGYGEVGIGIGHLKGYPLIVEQAFDMRMRIIAYWKIVLKRMLDNLALHLLFNVQNLVNKEMETEIINEMMDLITVEALKGCLKNHLFWRQGVKS